jgi:hypothetical protein
MAEPFSLSFTRRNLSVLRTEFDEYLFATGQQMEKALRRGANYVKIESQRLCPVDTGRLRKSARIGQNGKGMRTEVFVSYNTEYAVYVHERLDVFHRVGQAKFLETVLKNQKREILGVVIESLREQQKKAIRKALRNIGKKR